MSDKLNNFVSRLRVEAETLINVIYESEEMADEWVKLGFSKEDFADLGEGENKDITPDDILNVIVAFNNLKTYFDSGNGTNLFKVKP